MQDVNDDPLVRVSATPKVDELVQRFRQCSPASDGWNRLQENDNIRFALWDNQSLDGKKHATDNAVAFPWEGAADGQCFLTSEVIDELKAVLVVSFWRAMVRATAVRTTEEDVEQAGYASKLLEWLVKTKLRDELADEVELSADYLLTYGLNILKPAWTRELGMEMQRVTIDDVARISQQAQQNNPGHPLAMALMLILDPSQENAAVDLIQNTAQEIVERGFKEALGDDAEGVLEGYELSRGRARTFVRTMRAEGMAELPVPYVCKNQPSIHALKPWEEVFFHPEAASVQTTTMFQREYLTEQQLRARGRLEGWNEEWVELAVKTKGYFSVWANATSVSQQLLNVDWQWNFVQQPSQLIEVLHAYVPQIDEDNIPCIWHTILHANIGKSVEHPDEVLAAKSERLTYAHRKMPFVAGRRERTRRKLCGARGIPQLLNHRQREVKVQRDALIDLTSMSVIPPVNVYQDALGNKYTFGPAVQNTVMPGREPKFMDVPKSGAPVAFELMRTIRDEVSNAFGLADAEVLPVRQQMKQQMLVNNFLLMWSGAFQQVFALVEQYLPDAEYQRITGDKRPLPKGRNIAAGETLILDFDVRELDMEFVVKQYQAITQGVLPMDAENVVDKAALARLMLRSINPSLAQEVIRTGATGGAQVMKQVQNDVMRMWLGFEPDYGQDDDPTAGARGQALQSIVQGNPKMQQALQQDQDFQQRLKKYGESIQFNLEQQANKQRGRTGV